MAYKTRKEVVFFACFDYDFAVFLRIYMYPRIIIKKEREKSLQFGHPWLFSGALDQQNVKSLIGSGKLKSGDLVRVVNAAGEILATGYFNAQSQIAVRIFNFGPEEIEIDQKFFEKAFTEAEKQRENFMEMGDMGTEAGHLTNAYRLVFSESDGLPGLIVDKYNEFLVIQIHTLGMDLLRDIVVGALEKVFKPKGIYERSDVDVRRKDGLKTLPTGVLAGSQPPDEYEICEHGVKFLVDIKHGQKTGFFLDQRENRCAVRSTSKVEVLNLFSYSGGFSLAAAMGGGGKAGVKTVSVDVDDHALELARKNFKLNGIDPANHEFVAEDVFKFLERSIAEGRQFDLVIVDPPAFVKSRENLSNAVNGYVRLNKMALKVLKAGGILATASCSSHVDQQLFRTIIFKAAMQAGADLVMLQSKIQPIDHPLRINFPEGEYLKFNLLLKKN